MARARTVAFPVNPDEATSWLARAPNGLDVSVSGHNSIVAYLAAATDWLALPDSFMVQTEAASEANPSGVFETVYPVSNGHPLFGTSWRDVHPGWIARAWNRAPTMTGTDADRRRLVGACGYCLRGLAHSEPVQGTAGQWWQRFLVAGTVVAIAGWIADSVRIGMSEGARIRENATVARATNLVAGAVDAYRERLQAYQATGHMPAPSALETQAATQIGQMSDNFWETFATQATKGITWVVLGVAAIWALTSVATKRG